MEEDKETYFLCKVAANHLVLAQFEPFRAILRSLRARNPGKARSILQSIIACGGRLDSVLWAPRTCYSPSLLTFFCTIELLLFEDPCSGLWSFDENSLKLRAEFLLYVQVAVYKVLENVKRGTELKDYDVPFEFLLNDGEFLVSCGEYGECLKVLRRLYNAGLSRLRPDLIVMQDKVEVEGNDVLERVEFKEEEMTCLKWLLLEIPEIFDTFCQNIELQAGAGEKEDSRMTTNSKVEGEKSRVEEKGLKLVQKCIQAAHLDAMKECLGQSDLDGAISHLKFLHLDYGLEEVDYRVVLQGLLVMVFPGKIDYGNTRLAMREKLLRIYVEMLSSCCIRLLQMIQSIQDEVLSAETVRFRGSQNYQSHIPLLHIQKFAPDLKPEMNFRGKESCSSTGTACYRIEMFHYARVGGLHILESIMDAALTAVQAEQFQEAHSVLQLFPRLQPLVAVMGWDMLSGKTTLRRKLLKLFWTSKSKSLHAEESPMYCTDEVSCIEYLCDRLCYQLDLASFVACVNSGNSWSLKSSLLLSSKESAESDTEVQWDPFVENFVLERLSVQSPLRVLFDVVPNIKFEDAIELISLQPSASALAAWKRMHDVELMHMRYAFESAVFALVSMERCSTATAKDRELTLWYLNELRSHLDAIHSNPRKILMVNIVISLVQMDDLSFNLTPCATPRSSSRSFNVSCWQGADVAINNGDNNMCVFFAGQLLEVLKQNLPPWISDTDHSSDFSISAGAKQALEWRSLKAKLFVDDWGWRLCILRSFLLSSERQWKWREVVTVLCATPSKLLNLCMQKANYDVGEEVIHRFSLSPEDKAALKLTKWVGDAVSLAGDGTAIQELDLSSLCSQLGPSAVILLCIDVVSSSAKLKSLSLKLLNQAHLILSEMDPGGSSKSGLTYWDQVHEMAMKSVAKRVLRRLDELLQQDKYPVLQAVLCGEMFFLASGEPQGQGHGERAVALLHQMIEDAHMGKRQFLSGKLHNLARAVADEEHGRGCVEGEGQRSDMERILNCVPDVVLGLGLRTLEQSPQVSAREDDGHSQRVDVCCQSNDAKETEKLFGPFVSKPTTYLSQFILHIAAIGDLVDGSDTTHDFNYFSVMYEWPRDLVTRLDLKQGSADAAVGKVAEIRCSDFVHEVIAACVPPVYPPRFVHSWACSPVVPAFCWNCSEIKLLSPSSSEIAPGSYYHSSGTPGVQLFPLKLDMVKHLVELSPVRAVLACAFGSYILYHGFNSVVPNGSNDHILHARDLDKSFYEFALDNSERFPALNNWIRMQTNHHRIMEHAGIYYLKDGSFPAKSTSASLKRYRDQDSDIVSEVDDLPLGNHVSNSSLECTTDQKFVASDSLHHSPKSETTLHDDIVFLSFDWESQAPFERAIGRFIAEGKLMDALNLSDRFLPNGASDPLLQLLIERGEQTTWKSEKASGSSGHHIWSNTWQYCIRMKDKNLAARLALKHLRQWELDAALDVLTMCNCHLPVNDPLKQEVVQVRESLLRYSRILCADDQYSSWQEVEAACKDDPEGLALKLAEKGAVSRALEVAENAGLSSELRRELQGRELVKLLTTDPLSGGGPAAASRFLSTLQDRDDTLPVAISAMQLLPNLRSKQLLVHICLKKQETLSTEADISLLNSWALGLSVLDSLPLPWQHRCSSLHGNPHLILEVLLMRKQLQYASLILREFPSLRDNSMILTYAAKAIAASVHPSREPKTLTSGPRAKQKTRLGVPDRSSFFNSPSSSPKEARRAFSWAPRHTGDKATPRDTYRKRKGSGLVHSEKVSWEAMAGIREGRVSFYPVDGQERLSSVSISEDWMLTGDPDKDESVRSSHHYESAPDNTLFEALLLLCLDDSVSGKGALEICSTQMKNVLSSRQLPVNASVETIGLAYHATEIFVQGLAFSKSQLRKVSGGSDLSSNSEKSKDTDDASSDAVSSSAGSQFTDELSDMIAQAEIWLGRAELLQSLLGSGIAASLDEIADKDSSAQLRDRLIKDERYSMAVYTCKKCKIDVFPVWNAWGHALIRMERYAQARVKFKQALQLYKGDPGPVVMEIVSSIEGGLPADFSSLRSMYDHLTRSAPAILDDSLSADSYLNILHMPSTFPRSERSTRSHLAENNSTICTIDPEGGIRRNLDTIRYLECVHYLQEYCRQHLLGFMFKHGQYKDACFLFFPSNFVPLPSQPSSVSTVPSSSSPQRSDPLAIDYGTIDDLCELCVNYGTMPVLEEAILTHMSLSQDPSINQYTAAALARICRFCESHKHFNYLYNFQVIKKDHISAGLCCIQLFMNSSSREEAIRHLDHAKVHFDEGLSTRYKVGDSAKVVTKGVRGKSASEKLSEEGLVKFSARIAIQVDVVKCFNTEGPQWKYSLFGNPNDPETFKRRCQIAETLAEKSFDLAFQIIYEFHLPAVDIYAGVAASLADRKRGGQLTEFFRCIKGTIDDDDWDQVLGAAVNVYANKHKERPDRLIDMLISSHRKVLACVVCGRLKSAFQIASKSGSVADVQYVAHQALHANALPVLDMCKQWLAQYM